MALASGTHVGPYEITGAIGAGGMGEVYRAHDPKLGRDVAIKILPEAFARDAERMARFQRSRFHPPEAPHPEASQGGVREAKVKAPLAMFRKPLLPRHPQVIDLTRRNCRISRSEIMVLELSMLVRATDRPRKLHRLR
jgi:serine/threonine protein kinase